MDQRIVYLAGKVSENTKSVEKLTECITLYCTNPVPLKKQINKLKKKNHILTALLLGAVGYSVGKYYQKQKRAAAEAAAEADILTEEEVSEF